MTTDLPGTVYLVGAGPGDPDLLTVKAQRLISNCGALVYDSLVPEEVLRLVSEGCECQFVGKRLGHHATPQAKTNSILVELARRHKCVVRLKGGDPFVFGRGGEEAAYMARHGIAVEVVPGVTAGIAAPAYMGIPVTHRCGGSSVTFVTGHEGIDKRRPSVNWKALAKATDCIVIYMGLHNLQHITEELIAGGLAPATPCIVIQQATVEGQKSVKAPLEHLVTEVENFGCEAPSIVMVGTVVNFQVEACVPDPAKVTMPIPF